MIGMVDMIGRYIYIYVIYITLYNHIDIDVSPGTRLKLPAILSLSRRDCGQRTSVFGYVPA
jgi:hypothetical protein